MDYIVVVGMGGVPQKPIRANAPVQNRVVSATGGGYTPTAILVGKINYTGLHQIVNKYGTVGVGGGGGPVLPTFGQIFPSGR